MSFIPAVRFMVVSDIHIKDEPSVERERFDEAIKTAYSIAKSNSDYNKLDAIFMVGDFADSGTRTQMQVAKDILDNNVDYSETQVVASVASHEFRSDGIEAAYLKLDEIMGIKADVHKVINGFHFVSISPSQGCNYNEDKIKWMASELKTAAEDDRKKPIFVFQHPHNTATVYGSILWGEDELITTYMDYPQIIHFSGHSHAPINDPRSIHQKHFTSLGTGTLSYFELDEFDKVYGTFPPDKQKAAQMLIVEADKDGNVRAYPYDLITDNYFPYVWEIDTPYDPTSFKYTDARYKTTVRPYFKSTASLDITDVMDSSFKLTFDQADIDEDYVNCYYITVKNADGFTVKHLSIWSGYYFYDMPKTLSVEVNGLDSKTDYNVEVVAAGFWNNDSADKLTGEISTK